MSVVLASTISKRVEYIYHDVRVICPDGFEDELLGDAKNFLENAKRDNNLVYIADDNTRRRPASS
jgi:hypothetical protein